jgi:hypothetical protein
MDKNLPVYVHANNRPLLRPRVFLPVLTTWPHKNYGGLQPADPHITERSPPPYAPFGER